ncbi:MAG: hypothetical protein R8P61_14905 [Bacteroidia bacterium]|nr:hypothetical protein [Bacteroidia bacterium]
MEKSYRNLGFIMILLLPLSFLAFYKSYFALFPSFGENINTYIHLHAFIATIWILMLIVQPILIRNRRNDLHKKIGKASYVVFPLLILSFLPQMIRILNSDQPEGLFFPLSDCISLLIFYSLAIYHKKTRSKHMRYMIGSALVFLGPTIGRIGPGVFGLSPTFTQHLQYGVIYSILAALILLDRKKGKKYQAYLLILGVWVVHQLAFTLIF